MATDHVAPDLPAKLGDLCRNLATLAIHPDLAVAHLAASLSFRLTLALHDMAFGPTEWAGVPDESLLRATEVVKSALGVVSKTSESPSMDEMVNVVIAVDQVIRILRTLA
ncbi:hypothetical protein [Tahibacter amnicola]|uniref:Uncharacterized protein n=1 Tax=Tahibacter amnicola TaxID=2976241 RepID=A0ABY6BDM1_9GAMM|nr:hypothetical protein [Tahibacter amnicola]UXI66430.1 hypothetical protein N4264_16960 [Tahibacter amnicola]